MSLPPREVARRVLARVDEGAYATLALGGELARGQLPPADQSLATELVYGVLRQRARLDHALARLTPHGLAKLDARVLDALRLGAYQILFLRVPAHAAVDDAVGAVKRLRSAKLAGFVNAVLRRLARDGEPPFPAGNERLAVEGSAPRWLVDELARRRGPEETRAFLFAINQPAPLWVRVNTLRATPQEAIERLRSERPQMTLGTSPLVPEALRLEGDALTTPGHAEGLFSVQDLAAQLAARLVGPQPGETILDACAGVGGKSTHLCALAGDQLTVDAADLSERKLELCGDTARRLGVKSLHPIRVDLTRPEGLRPVYDRILLDAPCSGLGVLRRHPEAKWRPAPDFADLSARQAAMLDVLAPRVKPGGILVFSVCTFIEGEPALRQFLATHPDFAIEPPDAPALRPLLDDAGLLHTWPDRDDADAFLLARLRRR